MIQNVLTHLGGVGIYGVISICIFFSVFVATLVWVLCLRKPYLHSMGQLPLEEEQPPRPQQPPAAPGSFKDEGRRMQAIGD